MKTREQALDELRESVKWANINGRISFYAEELQSLVDAFLAHPEPGGGDAMGKHFCAGGKSDEIGELAKAICRDICELDRDDPDHDETVCVSLSPLLATIENRLRAAHDAARVPVEVARTIIAIEDSVGRVVDEKDWDTSVAWARKVMEERGE